MISVWESLEFPRASGARDRRFKSDHADCRDLGLGLRDWGREFVIPALNPILFIAVVSVLVRAGGC